MIEINEQMIEIARGVPIFEILRSCHVDLPLLDDVAQQFACPLHGDGKDESRSARYYPDGNSTYCWACAKGRDSIEWYKDYHKLDFKTSVEHICRDFAHYEPRKGLIRVEIEGKLVLEGFERDFRTISNRLSLADKIALSQTLDKLWQTGCSVQAQRKVEDFLHRKKASNAGRT